MQLIPAGKNQTVLLTKGKKIFFSYQTPVAAEVDCTLYATNKKHSQTTSRHLAAFIDQYIQKPIYKEQSFFDKIIK